MREEELEHEIDRLKAREEELEHRIDDLVKQLAATQKPAVLAPGLYQVK